MLARNVQSARVDQSEHEAMTYDGHHEPCMHPSVVAPYLHLHSSLNVRPTRVILNRLITRHVHTQVEVSGFFLLIDRPTDLPTDQGMLERKSVGPSEQRRSGLICDHTSAPSRMRSGTSIGAVRTPLFQPVHCIDGRRLTGE